MVAERSVYLRRNMVTYFGKIRSENVDMSNDKQCVKHCRLKFKVSEKRLIRFGKNKSVPKKKTKVVFNGFLKVTNSKYNFYLMVYKSYITVSRNSF